MAPIELRELGQHFRGGILLTCSSHESRCLGVLDKWRNWVPRRVLLFHFDDDNLRRERNHQLLQAKYGNRTHVDNLNLSSSDLAQSLADHREALLSSVESFPAESLVLDITVMTKRLLFMLLRWIDDHQAWDRLSIIYTEPEQYHVTKNMPLSFGVSVVEDIPGFSSAPDPSRSMLSTIFLGLEGSRAHATYEILQPSRTKLVLPEPPYRPEIAGLSRQLNADLIALVGEREVTEVPALDPQATLRFLRAALGNEGERHDFSRSICPLGSKPQAVGAYLYLRECVDPPAVVYTAPLRHNHDFFSEGIRKTWLLK